MIFLPKSLIDSKAIQSQPTLPKRRKQKNKKRQKDEDNVIKKKKKEKKIPDKKIPKSITLFFFLRRHFTYLNSNYFKFLFIYIDYSL